MNRKIQEISAGGVVYKLQKSNNGEQDFLWLIGMHSGYHKWVLPKGRLENNETSKEAAIREVEEETGIVAEIKIDEPIHIEKYTYFAKLQVTSNKLQETNKDQASSSKQQPERRVAVYQENVEFDQSSANLVEVDKTVEFYLMEYKTGDVSQKDWEMTEAKWVNFDEAFEMLSFEGEKKAIKKANSFLEKL